MKMVKNNGGTRKMQISQLK